MKRVAFVLVLLFGAVLAIPAMAEKIEMTDAELAQICAQGWGPEVSDVSNITEPVNAINEANQKIMSSIPKGAHGVELTIAPTTIKIDSIQADTPMGLFAMGDIAMRVTAKVTVCYND